MRHRPRLQRMDMRTEMDVRPGRIFSIDIATPDGNEVPSLGYCLHVIPMERLVWTSMLFRDYRPAVFDDIPITVVITMEAVGTGTRYVFTALHRDGADLEKNKVSGFSQGTEIAVDRLVAHVIAMKYRSGRRLVPAPAHATISAGDGCHALDTWPRIRIDTIRV